MISRIRNGTQYGIFFAWEPGELDAGARADFTLLAGPAEHPELDALADLLRRVLDEHGPEAVGVLISPNATLEEMYLAQKLMRGLNVTNLDHRLRQLSDDGTEAPVFPWLGQSLADLENLDAALPITGIAFTNDLDKTRDQNIRQVAPELVDFMQKASFKWRKDTMYA